MTNDRHDYSEAHPLAHRRMLDPELFPQPEPTVQKPHELPASLRGPAWQPEQTPYAETGTQWNGETCTARRITAVVVDNPSFPLYWARHLVGTRRAIAEVTYGGTTFYLDDEDGSAWNKVTHGGSPHWPHNNITIDPDSIRLRDQTEPRSTVVENSPDIPACTVEAHPAEQDKCLTHIAGACDGTTRDCVHRTPADRHTVIADLLAALTAAGRGGLTNPEADTLRRYVEAELVQSDIAHAEAERWLTFIQRGLDTHMQFSVLGPDGIAEPLPCADWCYACRIEQAETFTTALAELIAAHEGDEWASHPATTALRALLTCTSVRPSVDDSSPVAQKLVHPVEEQLVSAPPLVGDRFRLQADGRWAADVGRGTLTVVADMPGERREQLLTLLDAYCQALEEHRLTPDQADADSGMPGTP